MDGRDLGSAAQASAGSPERDRYQLRRAGLMALRPGSATGSTLV
jgi:hypothetical protein